ncbi:uncharacterized protein RCC_08807 [Ramularia collo-cygni]|uniref:Uncharacterized protein n=1 Tax=Ramularia collo-cygni TaxID=112498 RepID=A0A2D3UYE7_9PEZI|nr:uncharacterized protein RCC_08807 [Ramularia collo-cygni]CZT23097.1 uncharacterized protein RCC_08807 [Ramularia collo-cygni]
MASARSERAPPADPAWKAAFLTTKFKAYQQANIHEKALLAALDYAATCHINEREEYNLAAAEAKRMGMTAGVHFSQSKDSQRSLVDVGERSLWEEHDEAEKRSRLVMIMRDVCRIEEARKEVRRVMEETRASWERQAQQGDGFGGMAERQRKAARDCCALQ